MIYPITGDYRPVLLLLEWCFAFMCSEMGIMFCVKYFKVHEKRNVQDLGFSALSFGLSAGWYFQIASDYYILGTSTVTVGIWNQASLATIIWDMGFIAVIAGGFLFVMLLERHIIFLKKFLRTIVYAVFAGIFVVLFVWNPNYARTFGAVMTFVILRFLFVFVWDFTKKLRRKPEYKYTAIKFLASVSLFGTGIVLTVDFYLPYFGIEGRLLGICLLIGAFLSLCIVLLRFPAISLLDWKKSLEGVFLISKAGMCLVQKSFGTQVRILDDSITTSAIATVNTLIKEMVASGEQGLSKVKEKSKVIFILSSTRVDGAVISNEDNPAIPPKLKQLVRQFEEIYGNIVLDWNGDGNVFRPVETIIEEIFTD